MSGGKPTIIVLVALALASCATPHGPPSAGAEFAIARGRSIAQLQCSGCHQIGPVGDSPNPMAPPFSLIRLRYNELSLPRRMAEVGADGHYEMPGFNLSNTDIDDVIAYVASFRSP